MISCPATLSPSFHFVIILILTNAVIVAKNCFSQSCFVHHPPAKKFSKTQVKQPKVALASSHVS